LHLWYETLKSSQSRQRYGNQGNINDGLSTVRPKPSNRYGPRMLDDAAEDEIQMLQLENYFEAPS
jgi:hypothetical protein